MDTAPHPEKQIAAYGTWPSPLAAEQVVGRGTGIAELKCDGQSLFWLAERPAENNRSALVRWSRECGVADVFDNDADFATRVNEYGGGAYDAAFGVVVASERTSGNVRVAAHGETRMLAAVEGCRFADFAIAREGQVAFAVREDHRDRPPTDPQTTIVRLDLAEANDAATYAGEIVVQGADFYAQPRVSPDGAQLAWIEWDHPSMPWDATRLRIAALDAQGGVGLPQTIAGGADESISHLAWSSDGTLYFTSDRSGWWNVYAFERGSVRAVAAHGEREIGGPLWTFGSQAICALDEGRLACVVIENATARVALVENGELTDLPVPGPGGIGGLVRFGAGIAAIAVPQDAAASIVALERAEPGATPSTIATPRPLPLGRGDIALPQAFDIPTPDGDLTHALFFAPQNAAYRGPDGALPPLVLMAHGGPTSLYVAAFDTKVQWWTTRGFAVAHVNFRGSTGYGTAYRRKLNERWCEVDVVDAVATAQFLIDRRLVDPQRIAIRGGSASGTWALLALAASPLFACATSEFGVTDLELLAQETHKFESRYMDSMIGPLPETRDRYRARSPIDRVDEIRVPVLLLQGLDDKVVLPNQAELMRDALLANGTGVEYHAYAGEGHGFRKRENVADALEREAAFYRRVFALT